MADIKKTVLDFIAESAPMAEVIINGSVFGRAYTATFRAPAEEGATLFKKCLAQRAATVSYGARRQWQDRR